ncbi:MAG: YfhO family protein, partial [Candidatus Hydrogenedentes bacterium]|nr:YfhO family protein [Candidatus Hydrogenedentota bacterium]
LMFDPVMAFRPDFHLVQQAYRNGEWPLWNPLEYTGMPLLANCQSSVFYPSRLVLLFLDVDTAMTLFILLKLWICGATAYLAARLLRLSIQAARFFSIAWMLGGFCLVWAYWPETDVAGWVPVLFVGLEFLFDGRYRRGFFTTALGATLVLIAGHPEVAFAVCSGMGLYFLARLVWERRWGAALWKPIAIASAAWTLALLVYGVQLFTFIEYLANSATFAQRDDMPLTGGALISFWIPRFFGTNAEGTFWDKAKYNSNLTIEHYQGMAVWLGIMLILAGVAASYRTKANRARIAALLTAIALGVLISLDFTTFKWVHNLFLFNSLLKLYHIFFTLFALPLLGAIGLERWFSQPRRLREAAWVIPLIAIVVLLTGFLLWFNRGLLSIAGLTGYVHRQVLIAAVFAGLVVLIAVLSCLWRRPKVWWGALTAVLAADLLIACHGLNPTLPRDVVFPDTPLLEFLRDQPQPCRVGVSEAYIASGTVCNYGIEEWLGYDGLFPERIIRFQTELGTHLWDTMEPACSVRYYLNDPRFDARFPIEELTESGAIRYLKTLDELEIYENVRAFPRAYLVGRIEAIRDTDALFARMLEDDYEPGRCVVTHEPPPGPLPESSAADLGEAAIIRHDATHVTVEVAAKEDAVLVLSDAYYPGWQARIDGQPAEVFPAYYAFRGVLVPAGNHAVEFLYRPASARWGLVVSTLALLAGLAAGLWCVRRRGPARGRLS